MVPLVSWTSRLGKHVLSLYGNCFIVGLLVALSLAQMDVCRKSPTDLWFYDVTPEKCYEECRARLSCQGVNYHTTMGVCYLSMDPYGERETCRDFVYSDRSTRELTMTDACQAADCSDSQVCVTVGGKVSCEYRECPVPLLLNGQVLGNQRYIGARISHLCDANYVLVGSPSLKCKDGGQWKPDGAQRTRQLPQCIRVCPRPTTVKNATFKGSDILEGSCIEYVCSPGYILSGPGNFTCTANGTWETETGETELPECLKVCPTPATVENATIKGDELYEGSWIEYVCSPGYISSGPGNYTCTADGIWVSGTGKTELPKCLKGCPPPTPVENATIKLDTIFEGSWIEYVCSSGYIMLGSGNFTCTADSTWKSDKERTELLPECLKECPTPKTVKNATIKRGMFGRWIEYVCLSGYGLSRPGNFMCTTNGTWESDTGGTELPECLKDCVTPPNILDGERNGDEVAIGSSITYSCQGEYKLVGPSVFKCAETSNWVPDGPCSMNDSVDALLTFPPRCVIENCTVKSPEAYFIHQELKTWTDAAVTCKANGGHLVSFSCEAEFLFVKDMLPNADGYHIGATNIHHGCNWKWIDSPDEFTFAAWAPGEPNNVDGVEHFTVISMGNGLFSDISRWILVPFICETETTCLAPPTIENGERSGNDVSVGSLITYGCHADYALVGHSSYKCVYAGDWVPVGDGSANLSVDTLMLSPPKCALGRVTNVTQPCVTPPDIENGTRSGDDVIIGSNITYSCQGEYKLVGPSVFNCAETGNWVPDGPCSMDDSVDALLTSPPRCVIENCEVKALGNYTIHKEMKTWTDAAATCRTNGGHLVSFSCEAEFQFLTARLPLEGSYYYIGATDMDNGCYWKWIDSPDEFTFAVWAPGQPDNNFGKEHVAYISISADGYYFFDSPSRLRMQFICEIE